MDGRLVTMDMITELRAEITTLTKADRPMGSVLSKSLELMVSIRNDGFADPDLGYSVDALTYERDLAMKHDRNKTDLLRRVVYGITSVLGDVVTCQIEQRGEERSETLHDDAVKQDTDGMDMQEQQPLDNDNIEMPENLPAFDDDLQLLVVKNEPMDPFIQSIVDSMDGTEDSAPLDQTLPVPPIQLENPVQPLVPGPLEESKADSINVGAVANAQPSTQTAAAASLECDLDASSSTSTRKRRNIVYDERSDAENEEEESDDKGQGSIAKVERRQVKGSKDAKYQAICTVCSKICRDKYNLAVHMRSHTGERKYSCSLCGTKFVHISAMRTHLRGVHRALPHECATCSTRFAYFPELQNHCKKEGHKRKMERGLKDE